MHVIIKTSVGPVERVAAMEKILHEWDDHEMTLAQYICNNLSICRPKQTVIGELPLPMCYSNVDGRFMADPFDELGVYDPAEIYVTCEFVKNSWSAVNVGI